MTLRALPLALVLVVGVTSPCHSDVILRDNGGNADYALIDKVTNVYVTGTSYAPGYFDFTFNYGYSYLHWESQFGSNAPLMWWNTQDDALIALEAIRAEVSAFGDVTGTKRTEDVYLAYAYGSSSGGTTVNDVYGNNNSDTNYSEWWDPGNTNPRFEFNRSGNLDIGPFSVWITTAPSAVPEPSAFVLLLPLLLLAVSKVCLSPFCARHTCVSIPSP